MRQHEPSVVSDEAKQVQKYVSDLFISLGNSYSRPSNTDKKAMQKSTKSLGIRKNEQNVEAFESEKRRIVL